MVKMGSLPTFAATNTFNGSAQEADVMLLDGFRVADFDHHVKCCACVPVSRHSLRLLRSKVRSTPKYGCKPYAEAAPTPAAMSEASEQLGCVGKRHSIGPRGVCISVTSGWRGEDAGVQNPDIFSSSSG